MTDPGFASLRTEYADAPLRRADLLLDPMALLRHWLDAAANSGWREPNAMALATCDRDGSPHCRIVLCKQLDEHGVVFFTNAESDKGRQLAERPQAAATFWWATPRERQVRIEGPVEPTDAATSDAYFHSRPRQAQIASAASPQSRVVRDRRELEERVDALALAVEGRRVPRPAHWHGYRIAPVVVEFWQGRAARLHDRFRYRKRDGGWHIDRLAP